LTQTTLRTRQGGLVDNFLSYYNRGVRERITADIMTKLGPLLHEDGFTLSVACGWDNRGDVRIDLHPGAVGKNVRADARVLPFPDESFDNVLGLAFLHHIKDYPHAIEEMVRVTRVGGRILLMEPGLFHPHSIHFTHIFGLTKERPIYVNGVKAALLQKCQLLADDAFFGLRFAHFFLRHYDSLIKVGNSVPKPFQGYFLLVAERVRT
jgi:SAM-dependent methyltransferase